MKRLLLSLICSFFILCGCQPLKFNKFQIDTAHEKCSNNGGIEGLYYDATNTAVESKRYWAQCGNKAIFYLPEEPIETNKVE